MAVKNPEPIPKWPSGPIDPVKAWVSYDVPADEFLVYFGGKPIPSVSDPLDAPGLDDVAILIGLSPNSIPTDKVVGIHIIPMLLGAVQTRPEWAVLTWAVMAGEYGEELVKERLPIFIDEVAEVFRQHWKPAPPIEEQLAEIARASRERRSA